MVLSNVKNKGEIVFFKCKFADRKIFTDLTVYLQKGQGKSRFTVVRMENNTVIIVINYNTRINCFFIYEIYRK